MGYTTDFRLIVLDEDKADEGVVLDRVIEVSGYDCWENEYLQCCKWYDWKEHMKQVSSEFPWVLIKLEGEGETNGDMWHAYFKDGKCQVCTAEIVYPPFDKSKLK